MLLFSLLPDPTTTESYTLSLHDALPISEYPEPHYLLGRIYHRLGNEPLSKAEIARFQQLKKASEEQAARATDRKSTRLNSSHRCISYAVFCLKKKKKQKI